MNNMFYFLKQGLVLEVLFKIAADILNIFISFFWENKA